MKLNNSYPKKSSGSTYILAFLLTFFSFGCNGEEETPAPVVNPPVEEPVEEPENNSGQEGVDFFLPNINLGNWKVTLPVPRADGKALEVEPPEILEYATNETLLPFMYNDSTDGSLVFYTYPGSTTANTSYSRTELREQMVPGSNNTNWTFDQGGIMRGMLSVPEVSTDAGGDFHRTMIMQIHGRLTNEQRDLIGEDDNNAPPVLKIYWQDNKVRVVTKKLKDLDATYEESLHTSAWTDNESKYFAREVGTEKFTLQVEVSAGKLVVTMDDDESFVFDDVHMEKWGVFENYFKAGNYLGTNDEGAFAKVKYYSLEVTHP
ncbi:polysaccharide lyase family 7 protein [Fulvivirga lutimaris]|uniref:polysaccharide lyase family 7 protein n=1 Tax=Fulvivirga lutimaris TaxID=1819566 RepID=UPI0012BC7964|nr:polysaccharide lyase family 7 protein [Fulvivirga lutimaris]MTI40105.1 polysaccharide lyase family 7 protein [Fulvivirga lutimaris]